MQQDPWRLAFGGMIAMAVGMGVGRFVYTPILPVMVEALGLTTSEAGLIASANYLGHLVGALLAALQGFRERLRSYLLAGLVINAAGLTAMAITDSLVFHLILRFFAGIVSAMILVFSSSIVLDRLAIMGRPQFSAVHFGGVGTGIAISAIAVGILVVNGASWQMLWGTSGLVAMAGFALVAWLIPDAEPVSPAKPKATEAKSSIALNAIIIAYGLFGFGYIITATFIVAIVRSAPEISAMEPYVWALLGLCAAPSVAFWMWVSARFGATQAFAIACLIEAAGVASSILWVSAAGVIVAVIFLGGTFMGITALGLTIGRRLSIGDPRRNFALMTASFGVGQVVGPTFAGVLADQLGGFLVPSLIASGALVVAAFLSRFAGAAQKKHHAAAMAHSRETV